MESLARDIGNLFLDETEPDVHFRVVTELSGTDCDTKRFHAHRLVLSLISPVFKTMLTEQWMALNNGKDIELPDVDSDSFEKFLSYFYKRTLDLDGLTLAEMLGILSAARKYEVPDLIKSCSAKIVEIIAPENAMFVLEKCAGTTDEVNENIVKRAVEVIARNIKEVFDSEVFIKATDRVVKPILLSNQLSVREVDVFRAVYNRAKAQSGDDPSAENVRDTMAPLLHLIRFPTMTRDEFISVVVPTHVLSDSQVGQIIRKPEESPFSRELRKRFNVLSLSFNSFRQLKYSSIMTISEPLLINDKQATFKTWTNRRFCVKIDFDYDVDAALPNVKISIIRKSDGQEFFPKVVKDSAPELLYYIDYDELRGYFLDSDDSVEIRVELDI